MKNTAGNKATFSMTSNDVIGRHDDDLTKLKCKQQKSFVCTVIQDVFVCLKYNLWVLVTTMKKITKKKEKSTNSLAANI